MQNRFTKKANEALLAAQEISGELGHGYIGTEHILAGLLRVSDCLAAAVLNNHGVTEEKVRDLMEQLIAPTGGASLQEPEGYTPRANRVL